MTRGLFVAALLLAPAIAHAEPRAVAFDYRNKPPLAEIAELANRGFDEIVLSPRAVFEGQYAELYLNLRVRYWVQPFAATYEGKPWKGNPYDAQLWDALDRFGPVLTAEGDTATLSVDDIQGAILLPFHLPEFVDWWVAMAKLHGALLLDYGCYDVAWEAGLGLSPAQWAAWRVGSTRAKRELAGEAVQCNAWVDGADGIVLEKVGWSLTPYAKAVALLAARPGPPSIVLGMGDERVRRVTASMAILFDAGHNWGFASADRNRTTPELHELEFGVFYDPAWEKEPGVWMRLATSGGVLLNLSGRTYRWGPYSIPHNDGLVFQRPSWATGKALGSWQTNQGR